MPGHWYFSPKQRKAAFRSGRFAVDKDSAQWPGLVFAMPLGIHAGNVKDWDYSGRNSHGTRNGGVSRTAENHPRYGGVQAGDFTAASSQYVETGEEIIGTNDDCSFSVWYAPNEASPSSNRLIFVRGLDGNGDGWSVVLVHLTTGAFRGSVVLTSGGAGQVTVDSSITAVAGRWYHLLLTLEQGVGIELFVDGISEGTGSSTKTALRTSTRGVRIGDVNNVAESTAEGKIKDPRIYNLVLPDGVVAEIYEHPEELWYPLGTRSFFLPAPELESSSSSQSSSSSSSASSSSVSSASSSSVSSSSVSSVSSSSSTAVLEYPDAKTVAVIGPAGSTITIPTQF